MKHLILYIVILSCFLHGHSQSSTEAVELLKAKISASEQGDRLLWMDSLTALVKNKTELQYDSIANATIGFAIQLDSLSIAAHNIADLIYYYDYYDQNYDRALAYFESQKQYYPKMNPGEVSRIYLEIGDAAKYAQDNELAIKLLDSAYQYALTGKSIKRQGLAKLFQSQIFTTQGKYIKALDNGIEAEKVFYQLKDTSNIIGCKILRSVIYAQQNIFDEAEIIRKEAIELAKKTNSYADLVILYNNQSYAENYLNNPSERLKYSKLAYETNKKNEFGAYLEITMLSELASEYAEIDSLKISKSYLDKIFAIQPIDSMSPGDRIHAEEALGMYYFKNNEYSKALNLWLKNRKQYGKQINIEGRMNAERMISDIYEKINNHEKQAFHLNNYIQLSDSINTAKNRQTLTFYQTRYETEKKNNIISTQQKDLALLAEKNKVKNQWVLFGTLGMLGIFGFILMIRSRNNYKKQKAIEINFSQKLLLAQENERTRVAKDLHDSVGQKLSMMRRKAENNNQKEFAEMTADTLEEVRSISRGLYPPMLQKLGLTKSIKHLLLEIDEETDLFVSAEIENIDAFFNEEETLNFYRFIQESVANVYKHASAKTLMVQITLKKTQLRAIIKDNGKGFENALENSQSSLGLKTMSERITLLRGNFSINSNKQEGTIIEAIINK